MTTCAHEWKARQNERCPGHECVHDAHHPGRHRCDCGAHHGSFGPDDPRIEQPAELIPATLDAWVERSTRQVVEDEPWPTTCPHGIDIADEQCDICLRAGGYPEAILRQLDAEHPLPVAISKPTFDDIITADDALAHAADILVSTYAQQPPGVLAAPITIERVHDDGCGLRSDHLGPCETFVIIVDGAAPMDDITVGDPDGPHVVLTTRPNPLACPDCGKTAANRTGLAAHRRSHAPRVPCANGCGQPVLAGVGQTRHNTACPNMARDPASPRQAVAAHRHWLTRQPPLTIHDLPHNLVLRLQMPSHHDLPDPDDHKAWSHLAVEIDVQIVRRLAMWRQWLRDRPDQ